MKKTGAKILRLFCEFLVGLGRVLLVVGRAFKSPLAFLWQWFLCPIIALTYRTYLALVNFWRSIFVKLRNLVQTTLYNRLVLPTVLVIMVFFVVTSNLYALADSTSFSASLNQSLVETALSGSTDEEIYLDDGNYDDNSETVPVSLVEALGPDETAADTNLIINRPNLIEYVVRDGDSVASIARRFNLRVDTVLNANNLGSIGLIRAGETLKILPVDGILYTVKKGDSLPKIAKIYQTDPDEVVSTNQLKSASDIQVGLVLILPGARVPYIATTPKPVKIAADNIRHIFTPAPPIKSILGKTQLAWPALARRVTQYFSRRHTGVDIAGPVGSPIYAAADGVVTTAGWNRGGYGNMIVIDHGNGTFTRYGHGSKILVDVGDTVTKGQTVMLMGSTGRSTGSHLHFEIMTGDIHRRINPLNYVAR